jgi:hypothetical protein
LEAGQLTELNGIEHLGTKSARASAPLRANICETVLVLLINERGEKAKGEMNGNSLGVLPSGALAAAERSGDERSEPERSAAAANAGADSLPASWPNPEVVAKPKRRTYTAEW